MNFWRRGFVHPGRGGRMVHVAPTIGGVEWVAARGWNRRSARPGAVQTQRVAADALDALRIGVLVLDGDDRPVLANPAAFDLGLVRGEPDGARRSREDSRDAGPTQVHAVIRTLAGQVRRSGARREVELDLPRGGGSRP